MDKKEFNIYNDEFGKKYSTDNLLDGILRFVEFRSMSADGDLSFDTPLDPGVFKRNPDGWNIRRACEWLHSHAGANSRHACAKYVRMAIEAGGLSTVGRPNWAWKYIDYLPNIGFKFIGRFKRNDSYRPQPGDIAVYTKGGDKSVPGHICMWTGNEWASDFKQKSMIVYPSTKEAYVFRFES